MPMNRQVAVHRGLTATNKMRRRCARVVKEGGSVHCSEQCGIELDEGLNRGSFRFTMELPASDTRGKAEADSIDVCWRGHCEAASST